MTDGHVRDDLGVYLAGALSPREGRSVDAHLAACPDCAAEMSELSEVTAVLDGVTPELLMDGPPDGGDLVLRRTVRRVRRESGTGRRRLAGAAAAVVVGAAALGGGFLVGQGAVPPIVLAAPASAPSTTGTVTGQAVDSSTGAGMTVAVVPAAGWVRVSARITGIPAGARCRLVVVGADGAREPAGTWLVSPAGERDGTKLDGSALVAPAEVQAVEVETEDGQTFVSVPV